MKTDILYNTICFFTFTLCNFNYCWNEQHFQVEMRYVACLRKSGNVGIQQNGECHWWQVIRARKLKETFHVILLLLSKRDYCKTVFSKQQMLGFICILFFFANLLLGKSVLRIVKCGFIEGIHSHLIWYKVGVALHNS